MRTEIPTLDVSVNMRDFSVVRLLTPGVTYAQRFFGQRKVTWKWDGHVSRGADESLAFPILYFPICSTTKRIFLGWVKEVRTTKS
jgi:hypothetical protein